MAHDDGDVDALSSVRDGYGFLVPQREVDSGAWAAFAATVEAVADVRASSSSSSARPYGLASLARVNVWNHWLDVKQLQQDTGVTYADLVAGVERTDSVAAQQIELDLDRTYPSHPAFNGSDADASNVRTMLANVLLSFVALDDSANGYAQGLNFLAGMLLIVTEYDEEASFWLLTAIAKKRFPTMWDASLTGANVNIRVLDELLGKHLSSFKSHLDGIGYLTSVLSLPMFMCLLVNTLAMDTALSVLDHVFNMGPVWLFKVVLALFQALAQHGAASAEMASDVSQIAREPNTLRLIPAKQLLDAASKFTLKERDLQRLQQKHRAAFMESMRATTRQRDVFALSRSTSFTRQELSILSEEFIRVAQEDATTPEDTIGREAFERVITTALPNWRAGSHSLQDIYDFVDTDGDGSISFRELMVGLSTLCFGTAEAKLMVAFKTFDQDHNGTLDLEETLHLFRGLFELAGRDVSEEEVRRTFDQLDVNGDGVLDEEEFMALAHLMPSLLSILAPPDTCVHHEDAATGEDHYHQGGDMIGSHDHGAHDAGDQCGHVKHEKGPHKHSRPTVHLDASASSEKQPLLRSGGEGGGPSGNNCCCTIA